MTTRSPRPTRKKRTPRASSPAPASFQGGRTPPASGPRDVYVAGPAYADVLGAELKQRAPERSAPADGVWVIPPGPLVDAAFARQVLPRAEERRGAGPNDLAAAILDATRDVSFDEARDLDVFTPELARRGSHALEEHPLTAASVELASTLAAKIAGRRAKHGAREPTGHTLRVLLVDAWRAWVSVAPRHTGPKLLAWPSAFPAGRALDEHAQDAPSSAHRKLDEALLWLEQAPGPDDVVLDLGAAPGGWTSVALAKGARVVAVDRADLDAHIADDPRVTHVRADAFKYVPERQPSWLLCDVIAEPALSLELAQRALASSALRALVVTLKLKRPVDLAVIAKAQATARRTIGFFGRTKQLGANKLEVTLMMRRT